MRVKGLRDGVLALFLAVVAALIAGWLGADGEWVLLAGAGTALAVWLLLAIPAKRQEARRDFDAAGEVRDRQVILSLYVPNVGWLDGARCEVRHAHQVRNLGEPMPLPIKEGIHPLRGVWRFPPDPADPEPGRYKALIYVKDRAEPAGVVKWRR